MKNDWDSLQSELSSLPDDEVEAMKDHFNAFVDGCDTVGDALFDADSDDFVQTVENLS